MRRFVGYFLLLFLSACGTLGLGRGGGGSDRMRLWEQAHAAFSADSFRVAEALFQRLAMEHPRTFEGHEARFYLGVLNLEPRNRVELAAAIEHLNIYLTEDSLRNLGGYHDREGESLRQLARELLRPCAQRAGGDLACPVAPVDTVTRTVPGAPAEPVGGASAAEVARLRREIAARDQQIRELREELQRIRNTLGPRNPRDD